MMMTLVQKSVFLKPKTVYALTARHNVPVHFRVRLTSKQRRKTTTVVLLQRDTPIIVDFARENRKSASTHERQCEDDEGYLFPFSFGWTRRRLASSIIFVFSTLAPSDRKEVYLNI
jgi:hypothetical protein